MKTIIMAWWSGTRLWPISRKYYPKQFIQLKEFDNVSFFQQTLKRAKMLSKLEDVVVVTSIDYKFHCINQAEQIWLNLTEDQVICEPFQRNTLWAICLWLEKCEDNDVALVLSSDHIIWDNDKFVQEIAEISDSAKKHIIIFWLKPTCPNTGYGYISSSEDKFSKVVEFKEKPDLDTAKKYVENGYCWNSWIFLFSKKIFLDELQKTQPSYYEIICWWVMKNFDNLPNISVDYGVLEKSDNVYVNKLSIYWNDLGSWDAFDEYLKDKTNWDLIQINSKSNFALSDFSNKKIAIIWLEDLLVIDTKDALLITKKWHSQDIKDVVNILKQEKNSLTDFGRTVYRPWWNYTIIDEWAWFKTKRITVFPWKKLSLQMHYHRSEHWVVVSWTANVIIWVEEKILRKWESVYISSWVNHRLENVWKVDLHIIESQIWDYLEEDDIVRFDDDFDRK